VKKLNTFDQLFEKLNEHQKLAVLDKSPALLLNAHVGSGKTTVLTTKVLYLYFKEKIPLEDMVVLTFTNKAANEIKERLITLGTEHNIREDNMPFFGTFHSVANRLLSNHLGIEELGYTKDFTIMDPDEMVAMAERLIVENNYDIKFKNRLHNRLEAASRGKLLYGNMKYHDHIELLWEHITEEKKAQNKMSFDDLIQNATILLKNTTKKPKWIIVDEFQDSDRAQIEFVQAMYSPTTNIFVVGDPNQIIYTWRGSEKNVFNIFKDTFNPVEMSLPINYRSSTTILDIAKYFLEDGSDLKGTRDLGNKITVINHHDSFNEAQYIADKINSIKSDELKYSDIAVFYRTQRQSNVLEDVFNREGVPFEVSRTKSLKDIPILNWFVSLLKASVNKKDKNNLIAVLSNKEFGEGLTDAKIRKVINEESESTPTLFHKIKGFISWCKNKPLEYIHEIYEYFELDNCLSPTSSSYTENRLLITNFLHNMKEFIELSKADFSIGIVDFLNSSALYGLNFLIEDKPDEDDSVKLMTLHACKGLEFKKVFIVGVNPGRLPMKVKSDDEYEEERRLFFVGITRAMDDLEISYQTYPDDPWVFKGPSSFIDMLPKHLIERTDDKQEDRQVSLQDIRRKIIEKKQENLDDEDNVVVATATKIEVTTANEQRVKHEKYGEGLVESEDDDMITVIFDDYGSKTFTKMFVVLEYL